MAAPPASNNSPNRPLVLGLKPSQNPVAVKVVPGQLTEPALRWMTRVTPISNSGGSRASVGYVIMFSFEKINRVLIGQWFNDDGREQADALGNVESHSLLRAEACPRPRWRR